MKTNVTILVSLVALVVALSGSDVQADVLYVGYDASTPISQNILGNDVATIARFKLLTVNDAVDINSITVTTRGVSAIASMDLIRASDMHPLATAAGVVNDPDHDTGRFQFTGLDWLIPANCFDSMVLRAHIAASATPGTQVFAGILTSDAVSGVDQATGLTVASGSQYIIGYPQTVIPEPATVSLLVMGGLLALRRKRR